MHFLRTHSGGVLLSGQNSRRCCVLCRALQTVELIHATRFEHWESIRTEGLKGDPLISFTAVDHKSVKGCIAGVVAADLLIYVDVQKVPHVDAQGIAAAGVGV